MKPAPSTGSLRASGKPKKRRMTWEETARDMAREKEDWSGFDTAVADGLEPGEKW